MIVAETPVSRCNGRDGILEDRLRTAGALGLARGVYAPRARAH